MARFLWLFSLVLLFAGCHQLQDFLNHPPTTPDREPKVFFSASPASGTAPLSVSFSVQASDPDGGNVTCTLDFGDGTSPASGCRNHNHTYQTAGTYTATLTVTDDEGQRASDSVTITVSANHNAQVDSFDVQPRNITDGDSVTYSWQLSDPENDPITCRLEVSDDNGHSDTVYFSNNCPTSLNRSYTPQWGPGDYHFALTIHDDHHTDPVHPSNNPITVTVSPGTQPDTGFDITLVYVEEPSDPAIAQAFADAKARWEEVITGDLPDASANIPADGYCANDADYTATVDDLVIFVKVGPIDGAGNVLGRAGPCYVRGDGSYLPYAGMMEFDEADLDRMKQDGTLKDVILHEMGHVLGIGTLWEAFDKDFLNYDASDCQDASEVTYDGPQGVQEWHQLGGTGEVPVENTGGAGTKCGHWREATFDNELMTGWINGSHRPLSRVTIGSLEDLGYRVDYAAADPYQLPSGAAIQGTGFELKEILIHPRLP